MKRLYYRCHFSMYLYNSVATLLCKISCFFLIYSIFWVVQIFPQNSDNALLKYTGNNSYRLIERTDLRRYDNKKYTGLLSRIVNSAITVDNSNNDNPNVTVFTGNFWVDQATKKSAATLASITQSIPSTFSIATDGTLTMIEDNGYPSFRGFPSYPKSAVKVGDKWRATAFRAVDPRDDGTITRLRIDIEYTYLGIQKFKGEDVFTLSAAWATRYGLSYHDYNGDQTLKSATGSHKATMYISCNTGAALVVRDSVDEEFSYTNGDTIAFKGTISLFTEYPPARDTSPIYETLNRSQFIAKDTAQSNSDITGGGEKSAPPIDNKRNNDLIIGSLSVGDGAQGSKPLVSATQTDAGLLLTLQNLHFKSDEAVLLDSDKGLIKDVAAALKRAASDQKFLIEGHTASTGNLKGEKTLSEERAKTIADLLVAEGISSSRVILRGSGATKPIAPNDTKEGKARNRRVEITVLN